MQLTEHRLHEMSRIEVRFFTGPSSKYFEFPTRVVHYTILVVKYSGVFGWGSGGNGDATYMGSMAKAGIQAFRPQGVIHDFSELSYEWGDELLGAMLIGTEIRPKARAVVVSPKCEAAVRTLCFDDPRSTEPLEKIGWVFRTLDAAREYVDTHIA